MGNSAPPTGRSLGRRGPAESPRPCDHNPAAAQSSTSRWREDVPLLQSALATPRVPATAVRACVRCKKEIKGISTHGLHCGSDCHNLDENELLQSNADVIFTPTCARPGCVRELPPELTDGTSAYCSADCQHFHEAELLQNQLKDLEIKVDQCRAANLRIAAQAEREKWNAVKEKVVLEANLKDREGKLEACRGDIKCLQSLHSEAEVLRKQKERELMEATGENDGLLEQRKQVTNSETGFVSDLQDREIMREEFRREIEALQCLRDDADYTCKLKDEELVQVKAANELLLEQLQQAEKEISVVYHSVSRGWVTGRVPRQAASATLYSASM